MEFYSATILDGPVVSSSHCSVKANARLVDVFQRTAEGGRPYLFVEDEEGHPVGVLAAEDILRRVTHPNPFEMRRWMDMPADSALQSRIELPKELDFNSETDLSNVTRVTQDGSLVGVITGTDILISWKSIQKTLKVAQGDAVTGLPNRSTFDYQLEAEFNRARRCCHSVAVILVDLDHFKQINDGSGHASGDAALNAVATALRAALRSYDLVARFGGDEFAVICSGCRPGEIDIVLRRIRETVLTLQNDPDAPRPVPTISVGAAVAHHVDDIKRPTDLVELADSTLYAAKEAGRNRAYKVELGFGENTDPQFVEDRFSSSRLKVTTAAGATEIETASNNPKVALS